MSSVNPIKPYSFDFSPKTEFIEVSPTVPLFAKYHQFLDAKVKGASGLPAKILSICVLQIVKGAVRFTVGLVVATLVAGVAAAFFGFRKQPDLTYARDAFAIGVAGMA